MRKELYNFCTYCADYLFFPLKSSLTEIISEGFMKQKIIFRTSFKKFRLNHL